MPKRQKIDWENIKVTLIPSDKKNPNPLNSCSGLSKKDREKQLVRIGARIWTRVVRENASKNKIKL